MYNLSTIVDSKYNCPIYVYFIFGNPTCNEFKLDLLFTWSSYNKKTSNLIAYAAISFWRGGWGGRETFKCEMKMGILNATQKEDLFTSYFPKVGIIYTLLAKVGIVYTLLPKSRNHLHAQK